MSKNQNKSQAQNQKPNDVKPKANVEIPPKDDGKSLLLKFEKDAFYNGQPVYKKGVHRVETANGWAARWMARGAFKVDSLDSQATSSVQVEHPVENPPVENPPVENPPVENPPQDQGQGNGEQGADNSNVGGNTESGSIDL